MMQIMDFEIRISKKTNPNKIVINWSKNNFWGKNKLLLELRIYFRAKQNVLWE